MTLAAIVVSIVGAAGVSLIIAALLLPSATRANVNEYSSTMPRENTVPHEENRISPEYGETILGPLIDEHIDTVAAAYVIHHDERHALEHERQRIRRRAPDAVDHLSDEELEGRIEWWIRQNYTHLSEPPR